MRIGRYIGLVFLATLMCCCGNARAQDESAESRYPIIAAYIYNFTQFTTWPETAIKDEFKVCVLGHDPFGASLAPLRSRSVNGKNIVIKTYKHAMDEISSCNVLFIDESERGDAQDILKSLKNAPALTMSDMDGFADMGGMVEFERKDSRVGIKIDLHSVETSGISISSKLLRLADTNE